MCDCTTKCLTMTAEAMNAAQWVVIPSMRLTNSGLFFSLNCSYELMKAKSASNFSNENIIVNNGNNKNWMPK